MPHLIKTDDARRIAHVASGLGNWCSDRELIGELAESLQYIGDIRYGSIVADPFKSYVKAKLQDGRIIRFSVSIE